MTKAETRKGTRPKLSARWRRFGYDLLILIDASQTSSPVTAIQTLDPGLLEEGSPNCFFRLLENRESLQVAVVGTAHIMMFPAIDTRSTSQNLWAR